MPALVQVADPAQLLDSMFAQAVLEMQPLARRCQGNVFEPLIPANCKATAKSFLFAHLAELPLGDVEDIAYLFCRYPGTDRQEISLNLDFGFEVHYSSMSDWVHVTIHIYTSILPGLYSLGFKDLFRAALAVIVLAHYRDEPLPAYLAYPHAAIDRHLPDQFTRCCIMLVIDTFLHGGFYFRQSP